MRPRIIAVAAAAVFVTLLAAPSRAQVTPAAGYTPPDDTPSIKLGTTIFADYTYQSAPEVTDADGNVINPGAFNVTRAYINVTGQISHLVAFRVTPDITRETGAGSSLTGSAVFRLKYAFAQFNLDDWMPHGSWVRFGIQQTPWVDFEESVYRYRFQGTVFAEREGYLTSSDAGVSFHTNLPRNYGEVHVGYYNGDGYSHVEINDQKGFQIRGTVRPLPTQPLLRGLRVTVFYDDDAYLKSADRDRFIVSPTFEHKFANAGFEYLNTKDRQAQNAIELDGEGYSFWVTPKSTRGVEGLFRFDHMRPDADADAVRDRTIAGLAYWFPHQGNVATAVLLDYEQVVSRRFTPSVPRQQRVAVHALVNF